MGCAVCGFNSLEIVVSGDSVVVVGSFAEEVSVVSGGSSLDLVELANSVYPVSVGHDGVVVGRSAESESVPVEFLGDAFVCVSSSGVGSHHSEVMVVVLSVNSHHVGVVVAGTDVSMEDSSGMLVSSDVVSHGSGVFLAHVVVPGGLLSEGMLDASVRL